MILNKIRAKDITQRKEECDSNAPVKLPALPCGHLCGLWRVSESLLAWRGAVSRRAAWMSREPGQPTSKAAEVLRKLPDCINEVAPPGHNQISLENVASRRAAAHTWQN